MIRTTFYVRLYIDGHEGERMRWPADVLHEFARCLKSCRATGTRPTVAAILERFRIPTAATVTDLDCFRPFYRAYRRYLVDILAVDTEDTCNLKIHK